MMGRGYAVTGVTGVTGGGRCNLDGVTEVTRIIVSYRGSRPENGFAEFIKLKTEKMGLLMETILFQ